MDIRERAQNVREVAAELPDTDMYMTSLKNREKGTTPGVVVQMPRLIAAGAIVDATHRPATDAEATAHIAYQQAKGDAIRKADIEARFPLNLNVYTQQGRETSVERAHAPAPVPAPQPPQVVDVVDVKPTRSTR